MGSSGQATGLPYAFTTGTLHDPASGAWNFDTGASSHLNNSVYSLSENFNTCMYLSVSVGNGHSIPVTNTGHSIFPTLTISLHLNNVLITPHIVKNLIYVRQFVRDNNCTIEFDAFGFSVKDFLSRRVLLRCDITGDLNPVTAPSIIPHSFLRSLYRLKQAPELGFQRQRTDIAYLLLYIDDIVLKTSFESLLQQKKYAVEILDRAHMVNCNPSRTPIDTESKLRSDGDMVSNPTLYQSLACSLQYLTSTRPDISYAVQQVCLYMHDPREPHFSALKRILRYVRGTLDYGLQLFSSSTTDLVAYSDADWAGCPTTHHSTLGAEVEYRGVTNAVDETCWLRNLLREFHTPLCSATLVYCDNVRVLHVPSSYQYADIFTKGLHSAIFEEFCSSLSIRCPPVLTAGEYKMTEAKFLLSAVKNSNRSRDLDEESYGKSYERANHLVENIKIVEDIDQDLNDLVSLSILVSFLCGNTIYTDHIDLRLGENVLNKEEINDNGLKVRIAKEVGANQKRIKKELEKQDLEEKQVRLRTRLHTLIKAVAMGAAVVSVSASRSPVISPSLRFKFIDTIGTSSCIFGAWMVFGGNTRDLGSFGEETNEITDLHKIHEEIMFSERGDGVAGIKRRRRDPSSDGVRT
ncbi:ribonuclease H-like domain-containing protein [Tanacetum coccineum]